MQPNIALVKTDAAVEFVLGTQRDSQMKAWLGDPSQFDTDAEVSTAITNAHGALRSGAAKITALTEDATRPSDPEKHAAGADVSARTVAVLETARATLVHRANAYAQAADEALKERFALKSENNWVYDKWLSFVRETYGKEDGPATIREAMLQHRDLATLMMKMPSMLLGIPERQHYDWRVKAVSKWEPTIQANLQMAEDIRNVADRYVRVSGMVKTNFASPVIASRMKTRVAI